MRSDIVLAWGAAMVISMNAGAAELHVAPGGSDAAAGTKTAPYASLQRAQQAVRKLTAAGLKEDVTVVLHGGTYRLAEALVFDANDGGTEKHSVTYAAAPGDSAALSGGREIAGWRDAGGGVWSAAVPDVKAGKWRFDELFVNGRRAVRARQPNDGYCRVVRAGPDKRTSFAFKAGDVKAWPDIADVEVVYLHDWAISRVPAKAVDEAAATLALAGAIGNSNRPYWVIQPGERYFLENSAAFLDAPGEWQLDAKAGLLRYRPLAGEKLGSLHVVAPAAAGPLIVLAGRADRPVRNLYFRGLAVRHCAYLPPDRRYAGGQACWHASGPAGTGSDLRRAVPAAVEAQFADGCRFEAGRVEHVGTSGVWFGRGCRGCAVVGCTVADVGGNGVMIGAPGHSDNAAGNSVTDCLIERCGQRFFGAVGVWVGMTQRTTVAHNEIRRLPYSGVSVGWQWNPQPTPCRENVVENNHIHHVMGTLSDGGGIYTLGRQGGSALRGNVIHDVPVNAGRAESNGMFLDEGTSDFVIEDNVIYGVVRSPLRFHKATTNLVKGNLLVCGKGTPRIRYNATDAKNIAQQGNTVVEAAVGAAPPADLRSRIGAAASRAGPRAPWRAAIDLGND